MTRTSEKTRRLLGELIDLVPRRCGFTLVELLAVILILGILLALLLPAINGAMRTAKNAAVGGEINQLAQALANFKAKYGDYPPSRIYLAEDGNFGEAAATAIAPGDMTFQQLALRSVAILRKFFPRAVFNSSNTVYWPHTGNQWYDFNGNGLFETTPYILQGHECLVFFLGGIPQPNPLPPTTAVFVQGATFGVTGFGKDPMNPFSNTIVSDPRAPYNGNQNAMYSPNRQAPLFEFVNNRLLLDPNGTSGIPAYLDPLGNAAPTANPNPNDPINFYAYFSSYGNGGYDPNDVNFITDNENPTTLVTPELNYAVNFPIPPTSTPPKPSTSYGPNPYTTSYAVGGTGTATFINPQSFQIISSGIDGLYGVGGQYLPDNTAESLPMDPASSYTNNWVGGGLRSCERDNITSFHNGRLE